MDEAALENTVEKLHGHGQAATYGAVAGVVGGYHRTVMQGLHHAHRYSWVVNKRTRVPTGYEPHEIDPRLSQSITERGVIETPEDLDDWLRRASEETQAKQPAVSQAASAHKPIWEVIEEENRSIPPEVWDTLPTDLSEQHDHYIYGTPKRPTA
jgi:hypothetical protein